MPRTVDTRVRLQKPLDRTIRAGHPWVYRDALQPFEAAPGTIVSVLDKSNRFVGRGLSEAGPIGVRVFTTRDEALDASLFTRRVERAFSLRARVVPAATNAYRLLHGEGDCLPGLVCDRYDSFAVVRTDGEAALAWQERWLAWLREPLAALGVHNVLVRTSRKQQLGVTRAYGDDAPDELVVEEHGMRLALSLVHGQKTGLFLDHRESRRRVREIASGMHVLNMYGYTGGFSVAAGLGGAVFVLTVDSAAPALRYAERSWEHNGLDPSRHEARAADAAETMAELARQNRRFELIVADPPNFAPSMSARPRALSTYAALHASAFQLLAPGGYYLAASCSSHVTQDDFEATLREGARRARRALQLLERWGAPADHPRLLAFPEGDYLKVALLRAE